MTLRTQLLKLLFNKQLLIQRVGVAFMFTQQVALILQSGIGKYIYQLIQYQFCIRSARPKQKAHTKLVHDEQAKGGLVSVPGIDILFQNVHEFLQLKKIQRHSDFSKACAR